MTYANGSKSTLLTFALSLAMAALAGQPINAQSQGVVEDWSFHHAVFSDPGTADNAAAIGKYGQWRAIVNDPRFQMQQSRRARANWPLPEPEHLELKAIKKDWSMSLGSGATVGAGQYPAKFAVSTTPSCSDWVAYNTGVAGSSGTQANIEAYDNIYGTNTPSETGCGTATVAVPKVYWSYYSGAGKALTSPVISLDGTKIAYIENTSAGAILRIIQWFAGDGTAETPKTPTSSYTNTTAGAGGNKAWNTTNCPLTASCMISVAFQNDKQDTISAPFYVYTSADTLYVGDASGNLHKFTGVFLGTPGEVTSGGWPIAVSANVLTGPVYDSASGNVFVADSGGYLYSYSASTAAHEMTSSKLTYASGTTGIVDAPLVDSTTEEVYVAVGDDANSNTTGSYDCNVATGCSGVFQFSATTTGTGTGACDASSATKWAGTVCGQEAVFGTGSYPDAYNGSFDQSYYAATTPGTAGYLWECTPSHVSATGIIGPRLSAAEIQTDKGIVPSGDVIAYSGNTITAITSLTNNTSTTSIPACSPLTEFYNAGSPTTTLTTIDEAPSGITAAATAVTVTSGAGIAVGNYIEIGTEIMLVTAVSTDTLTISRGKIGTTAAAHGNGADITLPGVDYLYFAVTADGAATPGALACTTGACLYSVAVGESTNGTSATAYAVTGMAPTNGVAEAGGTSGIIIDNSGLGAGESQLYYTPLANQACIGNGTTDSNGTAGCATQTSQSAP